MQVKRFVNLNKAPTYIQDQKGGTFMVRPFQETLLDTTRRSDAVYVLEGAFWEKYAQSGKAGPLHPFPTPAAFGRETLPPVQVHRLDGSEGDGRTRTDGTSMDTIAVAAVPGKFRAAGDVLTPEGKIRRKNPTTGLDEEVEDTPENRNVLKPLNEPGVHEPGTQLKRSVIDYLEEMKIGSVEQFDALTDEQLLAIPGMNALALPRLRENIRGLLLKQVEGSTKGKASPKEKGSKPDPIPAAAPVEADPVLMGHRTADNVKEVRSLAKKKGEPYAIIAKHVPGKGKLRPSVDVKFIKTRNIVNFPDYAVLYRTDGSGDTVSPKVASKKS